MIQYVIAGLVLGGIYAIAATGLIITYVSAGILNFAFGSCAFFIARFYYFLLVQQGWSIVASAVVAVFVVAPLMGVLLYWALFRFLQNAATVTKVVATIGLSVALPAVAFLLFGQPTILAAPGFAPTPVSVYMIAGVPVTLDQLIAYGAVLLILLGGLYILRRTNAGLLVRAMVDSEATSALAGVNPRLVATGVWAVSMFLAGLAGVLAAPAFNLDEPTNYVLLTAAAFAAVVAAKLKNLGIAVVMGLGIGIAGSLIQWALPPSSPWSSALTQSVPFIVVAVFMLIYTFRSGQVGTEKQLGGALDRAIAPSNPIVHSLADSETARSANSGRRGNGVAVGLLRQFANSPFFIVALILPLVLTGYNVGLVGYAMAYALAFLSYTLVTGEVGIISLCQITFAGLGAITAGQLNGNHGWPLIAAMLVSGLVAGVVGLLVALLTIRMGNIYVALVTLTFGLLVDRLVFQRTIFTQSGIGVTVDRPSFAVSDIDFAYFSIAVFAVIAIFVYSIRRSTTGLALSAIRSSEAGSKIMSLNIVRFKLVISALAAAIAGIAGALMAAYNGAALPGTFTTLGGLVWLAVIATVGLRSNNAAIAAGLVFVFVPVIFSDYFPQSWAMIPTILFGLGAVLVAMNPDGSIAAVNGQILRLKRRFATGRNTAPTVSIEAPESTTEQVLTK
ncbi:branched-chain amino acid ABC transporter permease [Rhodococcus globerulus]|uniref:ABC transporter permease n=1 Tax=Rhodococcus globerulus TaxID=33008 RepID=A0ABU4C2W8_RHOGO|nr:ABC transporter permease [Rhodococcus globerulus]MDV6270845.1 ABC transporter permease [Rhodococcus globerulus]